MKKVFLCALLVLTVVLFLFKTNENGHAHHNHELCNAISLHAEIFSNTFHHDINEIKIPSMKSMEKNKSEVVEKLRNSGEDIFINRKKSFELSPDLDEYWVEKKKVVYINPSLMTSKQFKFQPFENDEYYVKTTKVERMGQKDETLFGNVYGIHGQLLGKMSVAKAQYDDEVGYYGIVEVVDEDDEEDMSIYEIGSVR